MQNPSHYQREPERPLLTAVLLQDQALEGLIRQILPIPPVFRNLIHNAGCLKVGSYVAYIFTR